MARQGYAFINCTYGIGEAISGLDLIESCNLTCNFICYSMLGWCNPGKNTTIKILAFGSPAKHCATDVSKRLRAMMVHINPWCQIEELVVEVP